MCWCSRLVVCVDLMSRVHVLVLGDCVYVLFGCWLNVLVLGRPTRIHQAVTHPTSQGPQNVVEHC